MRGLWFTKEQIEAEEKAGRFNSPWDERSFRSRILQDWLTMYAETERLRIELETARAMCRKIDAGLSMRDWHYIDKQAADWFAGFIGQDTPGDGAGG